MNRRRTVGLVAGSGIALAAGGYLVDRVWARRADRTTDTARLGSIRGEMHPVVTDDGVLLHAEVDEVAPYRTARTGDTAGQPTVVFVHGFALNLDCWHFQRQAFRGKRRMVFYDQRSHGRSGRSPEGSATIDQLGRDLHTVLEALAPDEKVVLVGHSMGGMTIVALAEQHPELFGDRIVGLGMVSTTAGGQRVHKILSRHIPDALGRRLVERGLLVAAERDRLLELARKAGPGVARVVVRQFAFGSGHVPPEYVAFVDSMIAATPLQVLVEFVPEFDALDKFHVVAAFDRIPTWIVCGTRDKLTSIGHARKLASRITDSHLVELEGGGHMPILEFKDEVNAVLGELFAAADEQAAGVREETP
jgi:pimeloyl-ACP methyl ester carboxylesterase